MTKVFTSINWRFLFKLLKRFNFGRSVIHWMKIIYIESKAYNK